MVQPAVMAPNSTMKNARLKSDRSTLPVVLFVLLIVCGLTAAAMPISCVNCSVYMATPDST